MIRPMLAKHGVGFFSYEKLDDEFVEGFRYENIGRYHNYYATAKRWEWPLDNRVTPGPLVIDGFSPNLNKTLHVGHLRNLAIANSLWLLNGYNATFVSLLGASQGVLQTALNGLAYWKKFLNFDPILYYDVLMPTDVVPTRPAQEGEIGFVLGQPVPQVWDGPNGPVIVIRADGRPLYAYSELVFAELVKPTHYLTGAEQQDHFKSLGFEDKHLPMGLVLGDEGCKLKSRDGTALPATEVIELVIENLKETTEPEKVAWNILAWNFLHISRRQDVKFEVKKWTQPEAPGLYITYTWARIQKALGEPCGERSWVMWGDDFDQLIAENGHQIDVELLGFASQVEFYVNESRIKFDPCPLANFTEDLARRLGKAYHSEKIRDGRPEFKLALWYANCVLSECIMKLGMFLINSV